MKISMLLISMLFSTSVVWAALITDDFNRPDQGSSSDGSLIGPTWANADSSTDRWALSGGSLRSVVVTPTAVLYNTGLETGSSVDRNFTLSADIAAKAPNIWSGVVFNYQNSTNFYVFRFKVGTTSYQLNRVVNGSTGGPVFASDATATFAEDAFYTLTVSSTAAYNFDFSITEVGSATVLNPITTAVDVNSNFTDGYAGVYSDGGTGFVNAYDNFSLEAIPEPATLGLLGFSIIALIRVRRIFLI